MTPNGRRWLSSGEWTTMQFDDEGSAVAYAAGPCPALRLIGRCRVCGLVTAATVQARWQVTADLLGWTVSAQPVDDPVGRCGHPVAWLPVQVPKVGRRHPCGKQCHDAQGDSCSCICKGSRHGRTYAYSQEAIESGASG